MTIPAMLDSQPLRQLQSEIRAISADGLVRIPGFVRLHLRPFHHEQRVGCFDPAVLSVCAFLCRDG